MTCTLTSFWATPGRSMRRTNCSGVSSMSTTGTKSNAARAPGRPKAPSNSRFISSCMVTRSRIGGAGGFQRMIAIVMPSSSAILLSFAPRPAGLPAARRSVGSPGSMAGRVPSSGRNGNSLVCQSLRFATSRGAAGAGLAPVVQLVERPAFRGGTAAFRRGHRVGQGLAASASVRARCASASSSPTSASSAACAASSNWATSGAPPGTTSRCSTPGASRRAWLPFAGATARPRRGGAGARGRPRRVRRPAHLRGLRSPAAAGRRLYYCVIEDDPGVARALARPGVRLAANSGPLRRALERRAGRPVLDGVGGINPRQFRPDPARRADGAAARAAQRPPLAAPQGHGPRAARARRAPGPRAAVRGGALRQPRTAEPAGSARRLAPRPRYALRARPHAGGAGRALPVGAPVRGRRAQGGLVQHRARGHGLRAPRSSARGAARATSPGTGERAGRALRAPAGSCARRIARVLRDPALRERLGAAGPPADRRRWTWETLGATSCSTAGVIAEGGGPGRGPRPPECSGDSQRSGR